MVAPWGRRAACVQGAAAGGDGQRRQTLLLMELALQQRYSVQHRLLVPSLSIHTSTPSSTLRPCTSLYSVSHWPRCVALRCRVRKQPHHTARANMMCEREEAGAGAGAGACVHFGRVCSFGGSYRSLWIEKFFAELGGPPTAEDMAKLPAHMDRGCALQLGGGSSEVRSLALVCVWVRTCARVRHGCAQVHARMHRWTVLP